MRQRQPFGADDLRELDEELLARAARVIAMEDVHDGDRDPRAIALRHDVDAAHALETACRIAEWEAERGYRATYYLLHTSPYWDHHTFAEQVRRIADCGHEIGIHTNALAQALRTGGDPDSILEHAVNRLRGLGYPVRGVAGHGDPFCNRDRGPDEITFANDEQFLECARPQEGEPDRVVTRGAISLRLRPRPLAEFGLEYEALKVAMPIPFRVSDSGGRWLRPGWQETVERWQADRAKYPSIGEHNSWVRQLHFLWHPDWWAEAFISHAAAA